MLIRSEEDIDHEENDQDHEAEVVDPDHVTEDDQEEEEARNQIVTYKARDYAELQSNILWALTLFNNDDKHSWWYVFVFDVYVDTLG